MLSRARFPQLSIQFSVQSEITALAEKTYRHSEKTYRHIISQSFVALWLLLGVEDTFGIQQEKIKGQKKVSKAVFHCDVPCVDIFYTKELSQIILAREFPFFSPVRRKIRALPPSTAILSSIAKNFLHFTSNCVAGTIFLSTIQAGSQSIANLLHEREAREWCFRWSGLVSTSVTG